MHEKTQQTNRDSSPEEQVDTTDAQLSRVSGNTNGGEGYQCENKTDVLLEPVRCILIFPCLSSSWRKSGNHALLKPACTTTQPRETRL